MDREQEFWSIFEIIKRITGEPASLTVLEEVSHQFNTLEISDWFFVADRDEGVYVHLISSFGEPVKIVVTPSIADDLLEEWKYLQPKV